MVLKSISSFLLAGFLILFTAFGALAQAKQAAGLLADTVDYNAKTKVLTAEGNVRIVSDGQILTTQKVTYNQATNRISIPNGFIITNSDGSILQGETADLSADLSYNLIKGANLLIGAQFQLAADQSQYKDNRFKVLDRVVASTCYVCKSNPIPFWQIRSNRVIHDEKEKRLYFEHARLEFVGVPIFYAPLLKLPDPTVDRASGFLVPSFLSSDLLKFGVKIRYFIAIDDHSDATITAFFATVGSFVVEGQYRRETKKGKYQLDGSLLLVDGIDNDEFRSSLTGEGRFRIANDYEWGFEIDVASDVTYRAQYDLEQDDDESNFSQDRLFSELYLERNRPNSFLKVSTSIFQSLRTNEIDSQIPLVFPDAYYRGIIEDPLLGGKIGFTTHTTTLLRRESGNNNFTRFGGQLDWQRDWQTRSGLLIGTRGQLNGEHYTFNDYTNTRSGLTDVSGSDTRLTSTLSADIRLPLSRIIGSTTHVIEPIVQVIWNEDNDNFVPNEDSVQVEFDETNLFSTNRFPGFDQRELGLRANVGVNYTRYAASGWNFGTTVGRVFRQRNLNQFSNATGLSGAQSDWVSAFYLRFPDTFELASRTVFDSNFSLSKNETYLSFEYKKLKSDFSFISLEEDVVAGASEQRREASMELIYTPNDSWAYLAEWRHDFITGNAIEGEFGLKYTNECVEIDLSLSLQYAASGNVSPTTELGLKVSLLGIGNQARVDRRRKKCAF